MLAQTPVSFWMLLSLDTNFLASHLKKKSIKEIILLLNVSRSPCGTVELNTGSGNFLDTYVLFPLPLNDLFLKLGKKCYLSLTQMIPL